MHASVQPARVFTEIHAVTLDVSAEKVLELGRIDRVISF